MEKEDRANKPQSRPMGGMFGGHRPGGFSTDKAKDLKGTLKKIARELKVYKTRIFLVLAFAVLSTVFAIASPKILGNATNQIVDDYVSIKAYDAIMSQLPKGTEIPSGTKGSVFIDRMPQQVKDKIPSDQIDTIKELDLSVKPVFHFNDIAVVIIWLIVLYVLSMLFGYAQGWIMSGVTQNMTYKFRKDIASKINRLPLSYFDKKTYGEVLSRITNDVDTVSQNLNQSLSQIVSSVIMIIGILIMMLSISWVLTLVAIVMLPISFVLIAFIMKKSQKQFVLQQKRLGDLNGHIEEMYGGHLVVKAFNGEKASVKKFNDINNDLYHSAWKAQFLSGLMYPLMMFVGNLGYVGVAVVGGWLAIKGTIKLGDIQAFIQYVQQFNQPISQTANIANVLQQTAAAAERVFEFLDEKEELPDAKDSVLVKNVKGAVDFNDVVFGYDQDQPIIKNLSMSIKPGQKVAIVGPTGAGKTTIVNLLMRFYEINSGSIQIDGVDTKQMRRSDVRKMFGMVLQDTWLFNGTIKDNIAYGKKGATQKEVEKIAKKSYVDHFVKVLPDGYDTVLDEEASNISQGEKQLLTIARAMLANYPMLILDEATSSVDTRTELLIQEAMRELMKNKTSFVIAHRLSTIKDADLILVVNDGNIIEQGDHEALLSKNGFYASLYNSQFAL